MFKIGHVIEGYHITQCPLSEKDFCFALNKDGEDFFGKYISQVQYEPEILYQKTLDSPFIMKIVEYFHYRNGYIVIYPRAKGDLVDFYNLIHSLSKKQKYVVIIQILTSLSYVQENGLLHGDIKLENFVVEYFFEDGTPKISLIDFGLSKKVGDYNGISFSTEMYLPPEYEANKKYNTNSETWCFGLLLLLLLESQDHIPKFPEGFLGTENFANNLTTNEKDVLSLCLHKDPSFRPSFSKLLDIFYEILEDSLENLLQFQSFDIYIDSNLFNNNKESKIYQNMFHLISSDI